MAEPMFTQPERDALLNYRRAQRRDTGSQVGSIVEDVGRAAGGEDPLHRYRPPGADNLTAKEKAELMQGYAEILAKLAQAEREAQSSDQDYASKMVIARNGVLEAMIRASADLGVADKNVAIAKVNQQSDIAQAGTKQYEAAQSALTLSPEGQAMASDVQKQVLSTGVLNPTATLQMVNEHLGQLSKTNPAQIPKYLDAVNAGFRATGRPEYRDFDVESLLSKMDRSDPGQVTLIQQLAGNIQRGDAAALTQAQLYDQGMQRALKAEEDLRKLNGGMPQPLRGLMDDVTKTLRTQPSADLSPQVMAPPPTADLGAKKAYVERASGGKMTLTEDGSVVNAAPAQDGSVAPTGGGPVTSYESFVQVYPGVRTDGAASTDGLAPTGGGYSRSGPTQDSIASMRKLREKIETEMGNLDKRNLDPLTLARQEALSAAREGGFDYGNERFALRAAQRTAHAEERGQKRDDRALRDQRVLAGMEAAPLREKAGAAVRQGVAQGAQGLAARGRRLMEVPIGEPLFMRQGGAQEPAGGEQAPEPSSPTPDRRLDAQMYTEGAKKALLAGDPDEARKQIDQLVGAAGEPAQLRNAAKLYEALGDDARSKDTLLKADNMEYALEQAARSTPRQDDGRPWDLSLKVSPPTRGQARQAQQMLETDPTIPSIEDWQPEVPGRANTAPQQGRDFARAEERGGAMTRSEQTGRDPLNAAYGMGDFGATESMNRNQPAPVPAVTFEQPSPQRPSRVRQGEATALSEGATSTGGDAATGDKAATLGAIGASLKDTGTQTEERPKQPDQPMAPTEARYYRDFIKASGELLDPGPSMPAEEQTPTFSMEPFDPGIVPSRRQRAIPAQPAPNAMPMSGVDEPMTSSSSPTMDYRPQASLRRFTPPTMAAPRFEQFGGRTAGEQQAWVESMRRTSPDVNTRKIKGSREEFEDVPLSDIPDWMKDPNVPIPGSTTPPTPTEVLSEQDPGTALRRRQRAVVDGAVSQ